MQETEPQQQSGRKAFLVHFALYAAVNAVLALINLSQTPDAGEARELWFVWPLAGWGIGVAAHALALQLQKKSADGGLFADRDVQGVAIHLFVYVAVNALLVAINLATTPDSLWFYWPLLGWGVGLAAHALLVYRAVMRRTVEYYAAQQQVLAEIQLERQAAEIAAAIIQAEETAPEPPGPAGKRAARKKPARKPAKKAAAAKKRKPAKKAAAAKKRRPAKKAARKKTAARKKPATRRGVRPAAKSGPPA